MRKITRSKTGNKRRFYYIFGVLAICAFMSFGIGYALITDTLDVNGTAQITSTWKVLFTKAVENEINGLKIQIAQIEDNIQKSYIKAPIDGVVLTKYASAYEFAQTGKPLFKMADVSTLILRAYVTADILNSSKPSSLANSSTSFNKLSSCIASILFATIICFLLASFSLYFFNSLFIA